MTRIFINAGHGGRDSGAVGNGLKEKDLTLNISKKVKDYLDNNYIHHETKLSRTTDTSQTLKEITDMANKWKADFLLSIHINAGKGTGFESFIYNGKIYKTTENIRSIIHDEITKSIKVKDRGKKRANFHVLRESNCPAMLTENLFIDTKADAEKLKDKDFLNQIAKAHAIGIAKAFNLKKNKQVEKKPTDKKTYRVVAGSFEKKENAEKQVKNLKSKGIDSFIL